jgi:hypothetical protein
MKTIFYIIFIYIWFDLLIIIWQWHSKIELNFSSNI